MKSWVIHPAGIIAVNFFYLFLGAIIFVCFINPIIGTKLIINI